MGLCTSCHRLRVPSRGQYSSTSTTGAADSTKICNKTARQGRCYRRPRGLVSCPTFIPAIASRDTVSRMRRQTYFSWLLGPASWIPSKETSRYPYVSCRINHRVSLSPFSRHTILRETSASTNLSQTVLTSINVLLSAHVHEDLSGS